MNENEQLDLVTIELQATKAFNKVYDLQNPAPVAPDLKRSISFESKVMIGALFGIMIASVIVSAAHTIPMFTGTVHFSGFWDGAKYLVGVGTLVMIEVAMIALAYFAIKVNPRAVSSHEIKTKAYVAIGVAVTIAISANVYSVMENFYYAQGSLETEQIMPINTSAVNVALTTSTASTAPNKTRQLAKLGISILIGLCAPIQALIAGDILGVQLVMEQKKLDDQKLAYQRVYQDWLGKRDEKWQLAKNSYMIRVKRELSSGERPLLSPVSHVGTTGQRDNGHNTGTNYTKKMDARQIILNHLNQYPDDINLPVRDLADKVGVGKSTVGRVISDLRSGTNEIE